MTFELQLLRLRQVRNRAHLLMLLFDADRHVITPAGEGQGESFPAAAAVRSHLLDATRYSRREGSSADAGPDAQGAVLRGEREVSVSGQEGQLVMYAQLSNQSINCSDLDAGAPADITHVSGSDVILSVWNQQGQCAESLFNVFTRSRTSKPLQ